MPFKKYLQAISNMISLRKKRWLLSLTTLSLTLFFIFILGEISSRVAYQKMRKNLIESRTSNSQEIIYKKSENPKLIYEYKKNTRGTNSKGYFDEEHVFEKGSNTFRIVIIGDSIAAAHGVDREKAFPEVLERKLNKRGYADKDTEIIVLARAGYNLSQEIELLEKEAFKYNPDLIIWSYCLNDPAHPIYHIGNSQMGLYFYEPKSYFILFLKLKFSQLRERLYKKTGQEEFHQILHSVYETDIEEGIEKISNLTSKNEVPVIFTIHPIFEENNNYQSYSHKNIHLFLSHLAQKNNLYTLDLYDFYREYLPSEIKIHNDRYFDPWHPNELGHKIAAEALANLISDKPF